MNAWISRRRAPHPVFPPVEKRAFSFSRRVHPVLAVATLAAAACAEVHADRRSAGVAGAGEGARVAAAGPAAGVAERTAAGLIAGVVEIAGAGPTAGAADDRTAATTPKPAPVVDDAGRPVAVRADVARIVSVIPSVTELLIALGVANRLAARTDFDTDPRLAALPSLGPTMAPSAEALSALHPDLVITSADPGSRALRARLAALGIETYAADIRRIADIHSTARRLGALLGVPARADSLVTALETTLASIRSRSHAERRPTVFYAIWHDPPRTTGAGTYIDEIITIAGGVGAFADLALPWPEVSLEELLHRDPDYIVLAGSGDRAAAPDWIHSLPGWRELSAVREGRVIVVDADLFNRPGPSVVDAARALAAALHPSSRGTDRR